MKYILFCGGGSAGHVMPNLAVIHGLKGHCRIGYMGTGGIEKQLMERAGIPFLEVDCPKLLRTLTLRNLCIPFRLCLAGQRAYALLRRDPPDLVFSKGGFAAVPAVWAAHRLHIPALTHESDLSPGLATRMLAPFCRQVLTTFPETAEHFRHGVHVGSPMREELFTRDRAAARAKYRLTGQKPVLLVLGGGSGSRTLNEALRLHLNELMRSWHILHLCGRGNVCRDDRQGYVQREFEEDMGSAYAACDFLLCRAGSNTISEAIALKKPALLVPLARCSRGDQLANAAYLQKKGLCHILDEAMLPHLPRALQALQDDKALRDALGRSHAVNGTPAVLACIRSALSSEKMSD